MFLEVAGGLERLLTSIRSTFVWFLPTVNATMALQRVTCSKRFATAEHRTMVRPVTCMPALVHLCHTRIYTATNSTSLHTPTVQEKS